jgi:rhamnose transport system permease protein
MSIANPTPRNIPDRLKGFPERALKSWEILLVVVMVVIFTINSFASPYFLDPWNLSDATLTSPKRRSWRWPSRW